MELTSNVTLRPLQQGDAAFLCSIFKDNAEYYNIFFDSECDLSEWSKRVGHFIRQDDITHLIIEAEGHPVGWLSYFDEEPHIRELGILVISSENRHRGYGAISLSWLIETSTADNIHTLSLNVNQNNTHAIQFYRRFGFEITAEEIIPQCNDAIDLPQYKMKLSMIKL